MAEPVTSASVAAAGVIGLLGVVFGPLIGGVMAVLLASIGGVLLATGALEQEDWRQTSWWTFVGVLVALFVAWPMVPVVAEYVPKINTEHLPSLLGLVSGAATRLSPRLLPLLMGAVQRRLGDKGGGDA
ncbi:hypothetical protein [Brachymonas sp.]|uniref:hypothetical protein n=1 Tax=Brachymonas sp. TaxID=1936292 RepID=UPI0035B1E733